MDFYEEMALIDEHISKKEYDKAREKINSLLQKAEIKNVEDENNTYFSFNNYLELMLYVKKYKPQKPNKYPDKNMSLLYFKLGFINYELKENDEALKNLNEGLKWNPINLPILFEKSAIYRNNGELERFKAEIEKIHPFITSTSFLAKYYREIGFYYTEKKIYDLANALYSISIDFGNSKEEKEHSANELIYIAQQENREPHKSTAEEIKKIFNDYNIPIGFNKQTLDFIYAEYQRLINRDGKTDVTILLSRTLYEMTLDKQFMITYSVKDEERGITLKIPEDWGVLRKSEYEKLKLSPNTICIIKTPYNENISVVVDNGECGIGQFTELYKLSIDNMKKSGMNILEETSTRFDDGFKLRQAIVEMQVNDRKIRMIQNFVRANNYLINISWEIPQDDKDTKEVIKSINNSEAMQIVLSVSGDKDKNNNSTVSDETRYFLYERNVWKMTLEQLEEAKGLMLATKFEMEQRIDAAEDPYINPAFMERVSNTTEIINQLDKLMEWDKYLQDVNEIVITIGKNIYRIKTTMIKHFNNDNTLLETREISLEEFKNIVFNTLCFMYDWNKSYIGKEIVENQNWSVLIKADNHDMKRFSGNNSYPEMWSRFYDNFVYAIEKSDILFFDEIYIKALIYLVLAVLKDEEQSLEQCLYFCNDLNLEKTMNSLPAQHPARVLFKTLDNLTDMQYAKLLIETRDILTIFLQDYPEENNKILFTIASEQDVDKVASKIVNHFKDIISGNVNNYEKMYAVEVLINEEYAKNGISEELASYISVYVNNVIENDRQDRFWSDSARNFLALIILSDLVSEKQMNISKLIEQTEKVDLAQKIIKDNIEKFDEYGETQGFLQIGQLLESDKPLKSLVEVTHNSLLKYEKK